ncbi:MAG TPA: DUF6438 domain-containing protein [Chloroflexia bacterium]|jgi:hypothetical protein
MKVNRNHLYLLLFAGVVALAAGALVRFGPLADRASLPLAPTPTADIVQARQAYDSGGALSYAEIIALQREIVGEPPDSTQIMDIEKYYDLYDEYITRAETFGNQLKNCRLKESVGWLARYGEAQNSDGVPVPGAWQVYVSMLDPYSGSGADADEYPFINMYLTGIGEEQVAQLRQGQQVKFSGDLAEINPLTIENVKYELLPDEFISPTASPAELENFNVTLDRTMCFGACPDYTVTVNGKGEVTFEGRHYTRVTGKVTATIDQAKVAEIVRELHRADFFSLDSDYSIEVTDLPTITLTVQMGGRSKTVREYGAGPQKLHILQSRIDQIVNTQQWIK